MFDWQYLWTHLFSLGPFYGKALGITVSLAIVSEFIGTILGGCICLAYMSRYRTLRVAATLYTWFFRGVPELVLLVLFFNGLAAAGIFRFTDYNFLGLSVMANFQAAVVAISLREGAYMSEIIRSGIMSVRKGQVDAGRAMGMSPARVFWHITLPQAMRVIVPPFGNEFNIMLKVTSLASIIGVPELFLMTETYASANFKVFELFIILALNYLALTTIWSVIQSVIEVRLERCNPDFRGGSLRQVLKSHLIGVKAQETRPT